MVCKKKNRTYSRNLQTIYVEIKKNWSWTNFISMISKWHSKFWFTLQVGKHRRYLSGKQARLDHFLCAAGLKSWNGHIISKVLDSFCIPSLIAMTFICSYLSMYLPRYFEKNTQLFLLKGDGKSIMKKTVAKLFSSKTNFDLMIWCSSEQNSVQIKESW